MMIDSQHSFTIYLVSGILIVIHSHFRYTHTGYLFFSFDNSRLKCFKSDYLSSVSVSFCPSLCVCLFMYLCVCVSPLSLCAFLLVCVFLCIYLCVFLSVSLPVSLFSGSVFLSVWISVCPSLCMCVFLLSQ